MFRRLILVLPAALWFVPPTTTTITVSAFVATTTTTTTRNNHHNQAAMFRPHQPLQAFSADTAAAIIDDFYQTQPYLAAFMTCSFKASAADLLAQTTSRPPQEQEPQQERVVVVVEQDKGTMRSELSSSSSRTTTTTTTTDDNDQQQQPQDIDLFRNLGFIFYGGLYQGMVQQFLFNDLYPTFFPHLTGWQSVAATVTLDMTVVSPFLCLPLAYVFQALFTRRGHHHNNNDDDKRIVTTTTQHKDTPRVGWWWSAAVVAGLHAYVYDVRYQHLLLKYWALWIPVQSMTFSVIPPHYRVAFVACVSFVWVFVLSTMAGATSQVVVPGKEEKEEEVRVGVMPPTETS